MRLIIALALLMALAGCVQTIEQKTSEISSSSPLEICKSNAQKELTLVAERLPFKVESYEVLRVEKFGSVDEAIKFIENYPRALSTQKTDARKYLRELNPAGGEFYVAMGDTVYELSKQKIFFASICDDTGKIIK